MANVPAQAGEDLDLAGKAGLAAAFAAIFAPLATRGTVALPSPAIWTTMAVAVALALAGIHLQAQAKPDE